MATKDWTTQYPTDLDTATEQPLVVNDTDLTRVAQLHAIRDSLQSLQSLVGVPFATEETLARQIPLHHDQEFEGPDAPGGLWSEASDASESAFSYSDGVTCEVTSPAGTTSATAVRGIPAAHKRFGGVEAYVHLEVLGSIETNATISLASPAANDFVAFGIDRTAGNTYRLTVFDSDVRPVLQQTIAQNSAWCRISWDGRSYAASYSLAAASSEPTANEWTTYHIKPWSKMFSVQSVLLAASGFDGGGLAKGTFKHFRLRYF